MFAVPGKSYSIIFVGFTLGIFMFFGVKTTQAKTTLTDKGECKYKLTVNIVLNFEQINTDEALTVFNKWQKTVNDYWIKNNSTKSFATDCRLETEIIFKKMTRKQSCADYPDDHCFRIVKTAKNQRGNVADTILVKPNSQNNSWGEWSLSASGLNIAHEVGHLMGLGDEYHYEKIKADSRWVNDNKKEYGPQSIMAQTWGSVAVFPEHVAEIFQQSNYGRQYELALSGSADYKISLSEPLDLKTASSYINKSGQKVYSDRISPSILAGQLVRNESDSAVYYMAESGKLRWISSEQKAREIFGQNWGEKVLWFNDAILFTYPFDDQL